MAETPESEKLAYVVSHDLRGPLRVIDGFSTMLLEDHGEQLDDEARRKLDVIRDSAKTASRMLERLLDWSRLGRVTLQPRMLEMQELAEAAFRAAREAEPHREVQVQLGALPPAFGDDALIRRVWAELASNAVKFTRHGAAPHVRVDARRQGDRVIYTVRDDGVGFDSRYGDKLFGVFQRLHSQDEFEGAGMGLALVKRIVERHDGSVGAESPPGGGAVVWFSLPANPPS
jgi:light-regulated signal transduction histidine kinase (bacteriophytochrome)